MADLAILQRPFDNLKSRNGADDKQFGYVPGGVLDRIIEATDGVYDWAILDIRYVEGMTGLNRETGETFTKPGTWMVHAGLTLPELGSKDGVGTAVALNENA